MGSTAYEVKCLLCASMLGEVVQGAVFRQPATSGPIPRKGGRLRCPRCGGSLYLEPIETYRAPISQAELRRALAGNEAQSARVRAAG